MGLHGPTVRTRFEEVESGILGAIDFLRKELKVFSLETMPYPAMIVPLARFFASRSTAGFSPTDSQRRELVRWFWRACFGRRYSGGVGRAHATDIKGMSALRKLGNITISGFPASVDQRWFTDNQFLMSLVNTKVFILMMAQQHPRSFISGMPVNLEQVLKTANRAEFHHVFPKKYLERVGVNSALHSVLANLCFLSSADNQKIKAKSPSEYKLLLPQDRLGEILASNLIPGDGLDASTYNQFLKSRSALLDAKARELIA